MPFGRFFLLYTIIFALYLFAVIKVKYLSPGRRNLIVIFSASLIFRLILLPGIPIHENDIYRYIWEGKVFAAGINPYKYPPVQASVMPSSADEKQDFKTLKAIRDADPGSYRRISYKDVPAVYPPLTQTVFALSALLAPGALWFMKALFVMLDMGVIIFIYLILTRLRQNPLYIIIYSWNPLVLKEFANSGHYDALAVFFVMAFVYFLIREKYTFSSVLLGLGILSKFYPLIFAPLFLLKKKYGAFLTSLAVAAAGYAPFFFWGNTGPMTVFKGLGTYARHWSVNGFIFELISSILLLFREHPEIISKIICGSIFTAVWIYLFFKKQDIIEKMFRSLTALFLLSPVGDPWYLCWVMPFICIYRKYSIMALSYLLILSYFEFSRNFGMFNIGGFKMDNLLLIQYVPFYLLLLFEGRQCIKTIKYQ